LPDGRRRELDGVFLYQFLQALVREVDAEPTKGIGQHCHITETKKPMKVFSRRDIGIY
jgi:hypothetical protein